MSPNGLSPGFNDIFILSSSESSDSESLLQEDIKSSESQISKQWQAIERTLYQEPGPQVTDTELLKECKLWRETFPHFRVKGTKIDINQVNNETDKSIQTLQNHFDPKKLEEKRENIKSKVVGMLVERLITKYRPDKENANAEVNLKNGGVEITEIDEDGSENSLKPSPKTKSGNKNYESPKVFSMNKDGGIEITEVDEDGSEHSLKPLPKTKPANKNYESRTVFSTNKESYFERGKPLNQWETNEPGDNLQEILDSWEKDSKTAKKLPKTYLKNDFKKFDTNYGVNFSDKPIKERFTPKKFTRPPNPVGSMIKPFEMTKKIDKKYEGLVDKIFERKLNELETIRHCRTSASAMEMSNFQESLEKLRIGSGFDDYMKRNSKPRLNKFDNNWLKRSEMNYSENGSFTKMSANLKDNGSFKNLNLYIGDSQDDIDDKFIEDLKREVALNNKRPSKKSRIIEEINLKRPKPIKRAAEKAPKSFSCGDLANKNKELKGKQSKNRVEEKEKKESNLKKNVRYHHLNNKGSRSNGIQSQTLPPIESGIICTELTGRPKIGAKIPSRRY